MGAVAGTSSGTKSWTVTEESPAAAAAAATNPPGLVLCEQDGEIRGGGGWTRTTGKAEKTLEPGMRGEAWRARRRCPALTPAPASVAHAHAVVEVRDPDGNLHAGAIQVSNKAGRGRETRVYGRECSWRIPGRPSALPRCGRGRSRRPWAPLASRRRSPLTGSRRSFPVEPPGG